MYTPKIRCSTEYRDYINQLYQQTTLDRNQLMRLMFFAAPFSAAFRSKVEGRYLRHGLTVIPAPSWTLQDDYLWRTQSGTLTRQHTAGPPQQPLPILIGSRPPMDKLPIHQASQ